MFKNPFSFSGRIRRTELTISWVIALILLILLVLVYTVIDLGLPFNTALLGAIIWFLAAQQTKRCHDLGNNGFFQLIPFYIIVLIFVEGDKQPNKYGENPIIYSALNKVNKSSSFKIVIPPKKNLEITVAELFTGCLLTSLAMAAANTIVPIDSIAFNLLTIFLILSGYYFIVHFYFKNRWQPEYSMYFLIHRAAFSAIFFFVFRGYLIYSNNITENLLSEILRGSSSIVAIFIVSYFPFLIYKSRHIQKPLFLEA